MPDDADFPVAVRLGGADGFLHRETHAEILVIFRALLFDLVVDDFNFQSNVKSLDLGEKAGVPFAPVGIYDYTNKLVYTTESDYNGLFAGFYYLLHQQFCKHHLPRGLQDQ